MILGSYLRDFVHILFPRNCLGCNATLLANEDVLCLDCLYHLALTDYHTDIKNNAARQLIGKFDCQFCSCMLHLAKSSRVEMLLHRLKYNGYAEIGEYLGEMYGDIIKDFLLPYHIDYIIPIPIHKSKLIKRGYNQAETFAKGLSKKLSIPLLNNILIRKKKSVSQVELSRADRFANVEDAFQIVKKTNFALTGKNILLIDDVLTTGATISAAGRLLEAEGVKISVITIAKA